MRTAAYIVLATILGLFGWTAPRAFGSQIFFADRDADRIASSQLDGSNVTDVATSLTQPADVFVAGNKVYWADSAGGKIQRANLDGSNVEDVIAVANPYSVAVDTVGGSIFFVTSSATIRRANLDGSGVSNFLTTTGIQDITLDVANGKIYWTSNRSATEDRIMRANLSDGSSIEDVVLFGTTNSNLTFGLQLAVDGINDYAYWTEGSAISVSDRKVRRAKLDGTGLEDLASGSSPTGIDIDVAGGKVYWTDSLSDTVSRADLDGANAEVLITGLDAPNSLSLSIVTIPEPNTFVLASFSLLSLGMTRRRRRR